MPAISSVAQGLQLAVESVEGTPVAANKKLSATSISLSPSIETNDFRPMGSKFVTQVTLGKDWAEGDLSGQATYTEIVYLLASVLGYAAPVQIGATAGYTWTFLPNPSSPDVSKSYSLEWGASGSGNARKAAGLYVNEFTLDWSRSSIDIGGSVVARNVTKAATLTASPTAIETVLALPKDVCVYMDDSWTALGTTKLLDVFSGSFSIGGRFSPWWTLNSANASFSGRTENAPDTSISLRLAADAVGYAYLDTIRTSATKFIRIEVKGANIGASADYTLQFNFAAKYNAAADEDDEDGALVLEPPMTIVTDPISGNALSAVVVNKLTTL